MKTNTNYLYVKYQNISPIALRWSHVIVSARKLSSQFTDYKNKNSKKKGDTYLKELAKKLDALSLKYHHQKLEKNADLF